MRLRLLLLFIAISTRLYSQDYPRREINLSELADDLYSFQDLDLNYEDLYENLVQLLAHPLDLNKANEEELRFLKVLSEKQLNNLIAYRNLNGRLLSVYELQAIEDFDLATIYKLAPFVTVTDNTSSLNKSLINRIRTESTNYFIARYERTIEDKIGFTDEDPGDVFKGSPDKLYMRFRSSKPGDFSFGFTAEKDQGEQIIWSSARRQYTFDHVSFHAQVLNKGKIKNLIVGDFQNQFGQGLILGGAFGMGKGGESVATVRRSNIGHLPYTSVYEAGYMRGLASTISLSKHFFVSPFLSSVRKDASLEGNPDEGEFITSFQTTGLHRNEKEIAKRKEIKETNVGMVLQFVKGRLDAGLLYNQVRFDRQIQRNETLYNQFTFNGSQNQNVGFYLNYTFKNATFFSELAHSIDAGHAHVAGVLLSVSQKLDFSILHRKYARNYYSFYANGFGENSTTQNETGIYWGWKYKFNRKFFTSGYVDLFEFPWLRFRSYAPSNGHEWLLRVNYQPSRAVLLYAQVREENKVRNIAADDANLYTTAVGKKHNYLFQCDYGIGQNLRLKTRMQLSSYAINQNTTRGSAVMQDIDVRIKRWQLTARYALFDTDDYDNRQYAYEHDVWLAYSLPAYYGKGVKKYVLLEYKVNRTIGIWLRYGHTRYIDREIIGSGADQIEGDTRQDIKIQTRFKF